MVVRIRTHLDIAKVMVLNIAFKLPCHREENQDKLLVTGSPSNLSSSNSILCCHRNRRQCLG